MKKYIREMLDDLKSPATKPLAVVPADLSNQELSTDEAEKVKQLDFQAQQDERRLTNS